MQQCRVLLEESRDRLCGVAQMCAEAEGEKDVRAQDRRILTDVRETLLGAAKAEAAAADAIERIGKIYAKYEQKIADYFDLAVQRVPQVKLGISRFENLEKHKDQMPFGRE